MIRCSKEEKFMQEQKFDSMFSEEKIAKNMKMWISLTVLCQD